MGSTPINISASRGASILGVSSYKTAIDTWLEIMWKIDEQFCIDSKFVKPEPVDNAAIRWGKAFEDSVIMLAEEKSGLTIIGREELWAHKEYDYLTCHIDGCFDNNAGPFTLHEGKTTSSMYFYNSFGEPGTDRVPMDYAVQCQHQLICTGAEQVDLSVLVFPKRQDEFEAMGWQIISDKKGYYLLNETLNKICTVEHWAGILWAMGYFHTYHIEPNEKLQSLMLKKYEQFWNVNILGKTIPEIQTLDDIKKIYTEPKGTVVADEEIERISTERALLQEEIKEMGSNVEKLKLLEYEYTYRHAGKIIDDDSREKTFLVSRSGQNLASYNGKRFYTYRDKK